MQIVIGEPVMPFDQTEVVPAIGELDISVTQFVQPIFPLDVAVTAKETALFITVALAVAVQPLRP